MPFSSTLRILDRHDVAALLTAVDAVHAVRCAFVAHSDGSGRNFDMVREYLGDGIFGLKSGELRGLGLLGFKAAGFWPHNRVRGGDAHQATIVLIDPMTGRPLCLMDGNAVTTMRTGAAGALGLDSLARRESARLCVFGTGVQARIQLTFALHALPNCRSVRYVTVDGGPDASFEAHFADRCELAHSAERDASVAWSDVVITATTATGPLFSASAVRAGTHFNCVGADTAGKRELPAGLLSRASLYVDDVTQARRVGEAQWAPEVPCTALGDVLSGRRTAHRSPDDITVFDMTGLALQDIAVAGMLFDAAVQSGRGTLLPWL